MTTLFNKMPWDAKAEEKFTATIRKLPLFHRDIAKEVVERKAQLNAQARGCSRVEEIDIVDAFFSEVPKAFYSLMIRILDETGLDYAKHITGQTKK